MALGFNSQGTAVLRRLLRYVRPYRFVLIPAGLAMIGYAVVTAAVTIFFGEFFKQLSSQAEAELTSGTGVLASLQLPLVIVGLFALRGAMDFFTVYGLAWVGRSAVRDLRTELYRHYLYMPASFYDRNATGDLVSRLTFNTEQIAEAISSAVVILVRDLLLVIFMLGVMLWFSKELTLILAVVGPLLALLLSAMSRAFRRYSSRIQSSMGDVTRIGGQALQGQRVIKVFSGQEFESNRFGELNQRNFRLHMRLVATRSFGDALTQFIVVFGIAVIFFLVLSGLISPGIDPADTEAFDPPALMGFMAALAIMLTALKRFVTTNSTFQRGIAAAESLFEILDQPAEAEAEVGGAAAGPVAGAPAGRVAGAVEFAGVSFSYDSAQEPVLRDLSFRLDPGKTLAIVGRSGSGKSTIASLLPRFYDVTAGVIRLDGRDIRDYPLQTLRSQFSFVGQDVVLFDDTIAGNIAYGALAGAPREAVERAAAAAHVTEFAATLPGGLDTPVGERGTLLSGGQRQRVAIARAILKDAPVLILDEATSALDTESERHVQAALTGLMRGRTTLVIAHRLSTVEQADRILVMRDGRVVETGTHRELIAAGGHYASLHRLQFAE
jgi:subfamily B ATP-binding cassette protein MsbA